MKIRFSSEVALSVRNALVISCPQALGLLEDLAQDQAASVALRLRDQCPDCHDVRMSGALAGCCAETASAGAGQSGPVLRERYTSLGLQRYQS